MHVLVRLRRTINSPACMPVTTFFVLMGGINSTLAMCEQYPRGTVWHDQCVLNESTHPDAGGDVFPPGGPAPNPGFMKPDICNLQANRNSPYCKCELNPRDPSCPPSKKSSAPRNPIPAPVPRPGAAGAPNLVLPQPPSPGYGRPPPPRAHPAQVQPEPRRPPPGVCQRRPDAPGC